MKFFGLAMAANERTLSPERVTESTRLVCHDQISLNIGLGEARLQRLRRSQDDSLSELARSWRLGISLAILSGVLFTASNFLIQVNNRFKFSCCPINPVLFDLSFVHSFLVFPSDVS